MNEVCNIIPQNQVVGELKFYLFVYEAELKKLRQPFLHKHHRILFAMKGKAKFICGKTERDLTPGTVFFTFPSIPYRIEADDDFKYMYISFGGSGGQRHLNDLGISVENCIFQDMESVSDFWLTAIRRASAANSARLAESVMMYTLSFIGNSRSVAQDKFGEIIEYIGNNFADKDISLRKIADIFFYSEKYLSALFKRRMGVLFTDYVNERRIKAAITMIEGGAKNVSVIAENCGFADAYYFSKVFKKRINKTPSEYIKKR